MIEYNLKGKLRSFHEAFSSNVSGFSMTCECGKTYYDDFNTGYDWEEGELEALEESDTAQAVGHSVGTIYIYEKEYVAVCGCWHKEARDLMKLIDAMAHPIADYLSREKVRMSEIAASRPTVEAGWCNMDSAPQDGRTITVKTETGEIDLKELERVMMAMQGMEPTPIHHQLTTGKGTK